MKKVCCVECKWKNEKIGMDVVKDLIRKSELLDQFEEKYYGFCSKTGFKQEVIEYAKLNKNIKLYTLEEILN